MCLPAHPVTPSARRKLQLSAGSVDRPAAVGVWRRLAGCRRHKPTFRVSPSRHGSIALIALIRRWRARPSDGTLEPLRRCWSWRRPSWRLLLFRDHLRWNSRRHATLAARHWTNDRYSRPHQRRDANPRRYLNRGADLRWHLVFRQAKAQRFVGAARTAALGLLVSPPLVTDTSLQGSLARPSPLVQVKVGTPARPASGTWGARLGPGVYGCGLSIVTLSPHV